MRLKIVYTDGSYIQIKLFDKPAVRKWFNFFKEKSTQSNFYSFYPRGATNFFNFLKSKYLIKFYPKWKDIDQAMQTLKNMNYNVPSEFSLKNKVVDQNFFNALHRFFTYNMIWYHEQDKSNPYDPNFKLLPNTSIWEWHQIIDPINLAVHDLEFKSPPTTNKKYAVKHYPDSVFCFRNTTVSQENWLTFTKDEEEENFTFLDTPNAPIVFLDDSILGKSLFQSFLDNDDPSCKDCTGRKGSFGSFCIDFSNNRKKLYKSPKFVEWLVNHNIDPKTAPYEFSIGYVEYKTHSPIRFKIYKKRFKEVIFSED